MTRRFQDRLTLADWMTAALAGTIAVVAMLSLLSVAFARDAGQWDGSDPIIRQWYKGLMQPDNPGVSCCGEGDAYWADRTEIRDGRIFAIITDTRPDGPLGRRHVPPGTAIEIPPHKLKWDRGNPTGHVIVFLSASDLSVLCYIQNGGV